MLQGALTGRQINLSLCSILFKLHYTWAHVNPTGFMKKLKKWLDFRSILCFFTLKMHCLCLEDQLFIADVEFGACHSGYESRRCKLESRRSYFESRHCKLESGRSHFESRHCKLESDRSHFESNRCKFESRRSHFESRRRKLESRRSYFESHPCKFESGHSHFQS